MLRTQLSLGLTLSTFIAVGCNSEAGHDDAAAQLASRICDFERPSELPYSGEIGGEPAQAELAFAPVFGTVLVGLIETPSATWELRASFDDGDGRGQLVDVQTQRSRDVVVRFLDEGVELEFAEGDATRLAPCTDCVMLMEPRCGR